jgi:hypothetical protein
MDKLYVFIIIYNFFYMYNSDISPNNLYNLSRYVDLFYIRIVLCIIVYMCLLSYIISFIYVFRTYVDLLYMI